MCDATAQCIELSLPGRRNFIWISNRTVLAAPVFTRSFAVYISPCTFANLFFCVYNGESTIHTSIPAIHNKWISNRTGMAAPVLARSVLSCVYKDERIHWNSREKICHME